MMHASNEALSGILANDCKFRMFEDKMLRLLEPKTELLIEDGGNCSLSRFIMESPAVELSNYIRVVKSSKRVSYITRECISLDMCTWPSNKSPGTTLQEQIHMA